jgi:gliding motility-associated-like protein
LLLSGAAALADYVKAIRSVTYNFVTADIPFENKVLFIVVSDGKAGSEKAERQIKASDIVVDLDIPSAFTPNGDFANDTWSIKPLRHSEELDKAIVRIYNKRGSLLFEAVGLEEEWDGRLNGEVLPADTYYYTIDFDLQYARKSFKGIVAILR